MKIGCRLSKRKTTQCGKKKEICNYFNCGLVLEDPRLELTNNAAERAVKPFVIGRKNWLFCNTPGGANSSAIIYSIIETAKENNLKPFDYLVFIFEKIRNGKFDCSDDFLPWNNDLPRSLYIYPNFLPPPFSRAAVSLLVTGLFEAYLYRLVWVV